MSDIDFSISFKAVVSPPRTLTQREQIFSGILSSKGLKARFVLAVTRILFPWARR